MWTESNACSLRLPKLRSATKLVVQLHGSVFVTESTPRQRIRLLQYGSCLAERLADKPATHTFELEVLPSDEDFIDLELELSDATSPKDAGLSTDARALALSLEWASIVETEFAQVSLQSLNMYPAATLSNETRDWVRERREDDVRTVNWICDAYDEGRASATDVIDAYIAGAGSEMHIRLRMVDLILAAPELAGRASLFRDLTLLPERVAPLSPKLYGWLPNACAQNVTVEQLWPRSPNELRQRSFPCSYGGNLLDETINEFSIKSSRSMAISASTYRFVLFDPETKAVYRPIIAQGSSSIATDGPNVRVDGRVVVLPDRFDGGNVAHLMFDTVTRMEHFIRHHGFRKTDVYYFGGIPTNFHDVVLEAVAACHKISSENIFFPQAPVQLLATDGLFWFSDQEAYHHPAQLMHPESRAIFRRLGDIMGAKPNGRRLYLSRSDASMRRVVNEPELVQMLQRHGFEFVQLSIYNFHAQIAMVSGADTIVAAHGMGLTHLIFNRHKPRVVELFNKRMGSNCYAWMAIALGFVYTPVACVEVNDRNHDYTVDVEFIEKLVS